MTTKQIEIEDVSKDYFQLKIAGSNAGIWERSEVRKLIEVLDNKKPKACMRCYSEEAKGMQSKRLEEIKNYPDNAKKIISDFSKKFSTVENLTKETLEPIINDLIKAAYNNAKENLKKKSAEEISKITGGIDLPFDFKLPF